MQVIEVKPLTVVKVSFSQIPWAETVKVMVVRQNIDYDRDLYLYRSNDVMHEGLDAEGRIRQFFHDQIVEAVGIIKL